MRPPSERTRYGPAFWHPQACSSPFAERWTRKLITSTLSGSASGSGMAILPGDTQVEPKNAVESGGSKAAAPEGKGLFARIHAAHELLAWSASILATASGLLHRIWQWLAAAAVWAGPVVIAVVATLTLIDIWQEWQQDEVIIDPVLVPEAVAKSGWTSDVLARELRDEIRKIDQGGRTDYRHAIVGLGAKPEGPDFTLAGGTISARTFSRWVHKVVSGPPKRLAGEVVALDEKDIEPRCGGTRVDASTRYELYARIEPKGRSWIVCAATLADLMQMASERTVRLTNPYRLAVYFGRRNYPAPASKEDLDRIRDIADEMLRSDAADEYEWALNLSGLLHGRRARDYKEQRPEEAKAEYGRAADDFEAAYRLKPDFSPAYINRGWALFRLGNYQESINEYNESIRIHKSKGIIPYSDSYTGLGFVYLELGDSEKAIANFEEARKIEPNYVDGRYNDDPYFGLTQAWQRKNDPRANEISKLRECLKSDRPYHVCCLQVRVSGSCS
jgi:Tetratricopeptide repeat